MSLGETLLLPTNQRAPWLMLAIHMSGRHVIDSAKWQCQRYSCKTAWSRWIHIEEKIAEPKPYCTPQILSSLEKTFHGKPLWGIGPGSGKQPVPIRVTLAAPSYFLLSGSCQISAIADLWRAGDWFSWYQRKRQTQAWNANWAWMFRGGGSVTGLHYSRECLGPDRLCCPGGCGRLRYDALGAGSEISSARLDHFSRRFFCGRRL